MLNLRSFLKNFDLNNKEIEIYLASLKYGSQPASIIAKKLNLPRTTTRFIFEELIKKGFAGKIQRKKVIYFNCINPELLEYKLLEKKAKVQKLINDSQTFIPILNTIKQSKINKSNVLYFEGIEGLCRMLDDFATKDQTVLYISGHNMMHPKIREYTYNVYIPTCNKHKNKNKIILNDGEKAREYKKIASESYDEFIFVDFQKFPFTLTTAIYGDKTAFWSYDPKDMSGVIIENRLIADN